MHVDIGRRATPGEWARIQPTPVQGVSLLRAHFVNHSFERHSHGEFCIGMTASGRQTFRSRGALHTSTRGRIVVFNPDQAHDGHAGDAQGFGYTMLYLQPEVVAAAWGDSGARHFKHAVIDDPVCAQALGLALQALQSSHETLRAQALLDEAIAGLLGRHGQGEPGAAPQAAAAPWLERARDFMHHCSARNIRVEELAGEAGVSRVHFTRSFAAAYGVPPHVYLNRLRIQAAQRCMAAGSTLAEAALAAGFADQSHLSRRFKGSVGVTPRAWLRQMKIASPCRS